MVGDRARIRPAADGRRQLTETVDIALEGATAEAFAPFGALIEEPSAPPVFRNPGLQSWRLPYEASAGTDLMVIRYDYRPMTFAKLERHSNVTQCFVPLDSMPWAMVVAPPDESGDGPAPERVRAFLVGGAQGILLWKDTWHAFNRFPAAPPGASFALLTGADTQAELEERMAGGAPPTLTHVVDYAERFGLSFRIVDPHRLLPPAD